MKNTKPPLGLPPKFVMRMERLEEVRGAISRYYNAGLKIPVEWIEEYNELTEHLNPSKVKEFKL